MSAPKQEILVLVSDEQEQRDLHKFVADLGFVPTVLKDPTRACELAEARPFALALVDVDTPVPGGGLELLWSLRRLSPMTPVVMLTGARSFEGVLTALRAGASDVVIKAQDQIGYLRQRVRALCAEHQQRAERERLLAESAGLNEEFLKRLTDLARRVGDLRDQVGNKSGAKALPQEDECRVLVVEDDGWLSGALSQHLPRGFTLQSVVSGGSALDKASGRRFHIALVKETLPDLPGRMVVRTLLSQSPETITLLFSPPGETPGQVQVAEGSHMIPLLPSFTDPAQLAGRLSELRSAQQTRGRERRYLSAFRDENYDLLRRYAELRQKLGRT